MSELSMRARSTEDVVVGDEIIRHRLSSRIIHWSTALSFFACVFSGLPIWTPIFGWMAPLVGGLAVCRWLHPIAGVAYFFFQLVMFFHWFKDMKLEAADKGWLGPKMIQYLKFEGEDPEVGKYNGGQKLFFFSVSIGAVGVLGSGVVLWFPSWFDPLIRAAGLVLHDLVFILLILAIIAHIYLGTAAEPGTFRSMVGGAVRKGWARLHHARWFRQVTGEKSRP